MKFDQFAPRVKDSLPIYSLRTHMLRHFQHCLARQSTRYVHQLLLRVAYKKTHKKDHLKDDGNEFHTKYENEEEGEKERNGMLHTYTPQDDNNNNNNRSAADAASKGVSFECTPPLQCIYEMDTIKMQELKHFRQYEIKFSMNERMYE